MSSDIVATHVTRGAWDFTIDHFSCFLKIAFIPFIFSVALNGFAAFSSIHHHPLPQALIDGLGGLIEALWGVRWLRFILEKDKRKDLPEFTFGKTELLYALYSLLLLTPFMADDFIFIRGFRYDYAFLYTLGLLGCLIIFLRFEFIFPALALSDETGFRRSWSQSKCTWGNIFKSYAQSLLVMVPLGCIAGLCVGLFLILLWTLGYMHFEDWTLTSGWHTLLERNPLIVWLYIIVKEGLWSMMEAFSMVIAATYYMLFKQKVPL